VESFYKMEFKWSSNPIHSTNELWLWYKFENEQSQMMRFVHFQHWLTLERCCGHIVFDVQMIENPSMYDRSANVHP